MTTINLKRIHLDIGLIDYTVINENGEEIPFTLPIPIERELNTKPLSERLNIDIPKNVNEPIVQLFTKEKLEMLLEIFENQFKSYRER